MLRPGQMALDMKETSEEAGFKVKVLEPTRMVQDGLVNGEETREMVEVLCSTETEAGLKVEPGEMMNLKVEDDD